MKKARQYMLYVLLAAAMTLAAGCGSSSGNGGSGSSGTKSSGAASTTAADTSREEVSPNGDNHGDHGTEGSTGVLDGIADDIRDGAEDLKDGAEDAVGDMTRESESR